MEFPHGQDELSDHEVERLLSGRAGSDEDAPLGALLEELRAAGSAQPSEAVRERHLTAINAAARAAGRRDGHPAAGAAGRGGRVPLRDRFRPRTRRAQVALAGATLLLAMPASAAGLATAGVGLPEEVNAPFQELGVELPNQARADEVLAEIEATPPAERGCAFGLRVAKAASDGRAALGEASTRRGACGDDGRGRGREPEGRGARGSAGVGAPGRAVGERMAREARRGTPAQSAGSGPGGEAAGGGGTPGSGPRTEAPPAQRPTPPAPRPGPVAPKPAPSSPGDGGSGGGSRSPQPQPDRLSGGSAGGSALPDGAGSARPPAPNGERP